MFLLQLLLTLSINSHGGFETHGGEGIHCIKKNGETLELFDYVEARAFSPDFQINLGNGDVQRKVLNVIDRIAQFDFNLALQYQRTFRQFLTQYEWINETQTEEYLSDDQNRVFFLDLGVGKNIGPFRGNPFHILDSMKWDDEQFCIRKFVILQRGNPLVGQKKFQIVKDLFKQADPDNQAGLILHEIFYEDAVARGAIMVNGVRRFNAIISSNRELTQKEFKVLRHQTGMSASRL